MLDDLKRTVNKGLLRYAVQRAIFCPHCRGILDVRDARLIEVDNKHGIICGACWKRRRTPRARITVIEPSGKQLVLLPGEAPCNS